MFCVWIHVLLYFYTISILKILSLLLHSRLKCTFTYYDLRTSPILTQKQNT